MAGNPIFNMMQGMGGTSAPGGGGPMDMINMLTGKFGNMGNAMKQLQGLMGKKGMNPKTEAMNQLKGKHFSEQTINDFREFAKKSGVSDSEIDAGLRELGIIK